MLLGTNLHAALTVFAAASLTDALNEIGALYHQQTKEKVYFNFAASSLLARQIEEGAPADLFFSADEAKMDTLQAKGLILPNTRTSLLSNCLVIVVPADSTERLLNSKELGDRKIKRLALAQPEIVPAGIYAKEYLQKQGLWDELKAKVIPTANVRAALAAVEAGNVDAAIVYKTDAAISRKVKVAFEVPPDDGPRISYPIAITESSPPAEHAAAFLRFVKSDSAAKIFRKFGFIVLPTR